MPPLPPWGTPGEDAQGWRPLDDKRTIHEQIDSAMEAFGRDLLDALEFAGENPEEGVGPLGCGPSGEVLVFSSRSDAQVAGRRG